MRHEASQRGGFSPRESADHEARRAYRAMHVGIRVEHPNISREVQAWLIPLVSKSCHMSVLPRLS